jgi:hypothetical protein
MGNEGLSPLFVEVTETSVADYPNLSLPGQNVESRAIEKQSQLKSKTNQLP